MLKKSIATLYCRVLELASEVAHYEGILADAPTVSGMESRLRAQLERAELDRRKMTQMRDRLSEMESELQEAKLNSARSQKKIKELSETALQLTDWNSQLETKYKYHDTAMKQAEALFDQVRGDLERQLVEVTKKRIDLQQEYTKAEEQMYQLRRQLGEQEEIQEKLRHENSVLKSKLYNALNKPAVIKRKSTPQGRNLSQRPSSRPASVTKRSPSTRPLSKSPLEKKLAALDLLDDVELQEDRPTITEIFKATFGSADKSSMPS